ncbi:transposase [Clostridium tetanomorphum]|uniref:IS110 family transposase n=1 Tax=Clostridium tetanomorphum TaxID=1553 RepID=A0A923ECP7_CLOTT|nr:IS110 family transposase [Clostridium tetanomorphum]KAJ49284.1 transposase IS116/IS110/IS902 family protein [Clostridium tetanomorphum DSM 665]KAJ53926.1 transposase IS116/IS110/IS902 family protein [Clostridium tetanomorphum DSM 665]MBC2398090.1 IS110 family transposase [Clostridium tetanomorphum]MBP1864657.1 transposase [Clostridium tetanomorphum]NRS84127.1 transposase [Clostridium tetanomorphum]
MNNIIMIPNTLILGIDIAKENHYGQFVVNGEYIKKPFLIKNTKESFDCLLETIKELTNKYGTVHTLVGMEPTGHYWKNIAYYLKNRGINICLVNPYHVNKTKELEDNSPTKNDKKDAKIISKLIYQGQYLTCMFEKEIYINLRLCSNNRQELKRQLIAEKVRLIVLLDEYFPELTRLFSDILSKSSIAILKSCPFPKDILDIGIEKLTRILKDATKNRVGLKKSILVYEVAKKSIGVPVGLEGAKYRLELVLRKLEWLQKEIDAVEEMMKQYLDKTGYADFLLSIQGVGIVTAASFLAEVGDISKYDDYKQIQKVAGLNLKETSSGMKKGKTKISKRGRSNLRNILYQAAMVMVAKNQAFREIYEHLTKRQDNKLTGKQAIVALSVRLIKAMYTLCTKKLMYSHDKVHGLNNYQQVA